MNHDVHLSFLRILIVLRHKSAESLFGAGNEQLFQFNIYVSLYCIKHFLIFGKEC